MTNAAQPVRRRHPRLLGFAHADHVKNLGLAMLDPSLLTASSSLSPRLIAVLSHLLLGRRLLGLTGRHLLCVFSGRGTRLLGRACGPIR